jgi:hypothetical protein
MASSDRGSTPPSVVAEVGGLPLVASDHLCVFYRGREERDRLMLPYLREGLRNDHPCLCIPGEGESDEIHTLVSEQGSDLEGLQVVEPKDAYLPTGAFVPAAVIAVLDGWSKNIFEGPAAPRAARVVADMSWAQPMVTLRFVADLVRFEQQVSEWAKAYPQIGMCMYDLDTFGGDVVIATVTAHPKVWLNGAIFENPYHSRAMSIMA